MATQTTLNVKVLNVCKTTAEWAAESSVISKGLLCVELADDGRTLVKIGDGTKVYSALPYVSDGAYKISDYYTKTETDAAIDEKIAALGTIVRVKGVKATVDELPTTGNVVGDLWFVGQPGSTSDSYEEYIYTTDNKFEYIGKTGGGVYELPIASADTLGGVKIGEGLSIDLTSGVVSVDIATATTENAGLLSAEDKATIDRFAAVEDKLLTSDDDFIFNCTL